MALPRETDEYLRESIECFVGLEISPKNMRLKILAAEDACQMLQKQVVALEDRVTELTRQIELYKEEATMHAKALKKCLKEKVGLMTQFNKLVAVIHKLDNDFDSFEGDLQSYIDFLQEEITQECEAPNAIPLDLPEEVKLKTEIEALEKDKKHLLTKITKSQEDAVDLVQENRTLEQSYNRLKRSLQRVELRPDRKNPTAGDPDARKRKSEWDEDMPEGMTVNSSATKDRKNMPPLSPRRQNTPEFRMQKK